MHELEAALVDDIELRVPVCPTDCHWPVPEAAQLMQQELVAFFLTPAHRCHKPTLDLHFRSAFVARMYQENFRNGVLIPRSPFYRCCIALSLTSSPWWCQ
jgi:hypothetical protein